MRRLVWICLVACFCVWGCATLRDGGETVPVEAQPPPGNGKVQTGSPYLDFTAPRLEGGELRLSSLVGPNVVLLQFWGIRCAPCLSEFRVLSDLQDRYRDQGLRVVGVNTDRVDAVRLAQAMKARGLAPTYTIVLDTDASLAKLYTPWLIPVSILIGRDGIVEAVHTGYKPELDSVIEDEVVRLLGR